MSAPYPTHLVFEGDRCLTEGGLADVAAVAKAAADREQAAVLVFETATGQTVAVDFRGSIDDVLSRLTPPPSDEAAPPPAPAPRGPGRPKLGVVAREVTLLPRHWEWLSRQAGGASVALRKLVDDARNAHALADRARQAQEAAYRFASTLVGDQPGFEAATRALFAGEAAAFDTATQAWPPDVRRQALRLARHAFDLVSEAAARMAPQ